LPRHLPCEFETSLATLVVMPEGFMLQRKCLPKVYAGSAVTQEPI